MTVNLKTSEMFSRKYLYIWILVFACVISLVAGWMYQRGLNTPDIKVKPLVESAKEDLVSTGERINAIPTKVIKEVVIRREIIREEVKKMSDDDVVGAFTVLLEEYRSECSGDCKND